MHAQIETKRVLIAKACDRTVGLSPANLYNNLGPGEVIVMDEGNKIIDTADAAKAAKSIRVFQGLTGGGYVMSDRITKGKIAIYEGTKFEQSSEQKVAIGFNGTAGSIDVMDDNSYSFTVEYENTGANTHNEMEVHKVVFRSPVELGSTTQHMVANELAITYANTLVHMRDFGVKVNVVTDAASAGGLTGVEVVNGSKVIEATGGSAVVGDVLIITGIAAGIWDMPARTEDGLVPSDVYLLGVDPYDQDSSATMSLGSTFVMNRITGMLVAEYTGRPATSKEYYNQVLLLTLFYNGRVNFENNLLGLKGYFEYKGHLGLLEPSPEIIRKMSKVANEREYGTPGTSKINTKVSHVYKSVSVSNS